MPEKKKRRTENKYKQANLKKQPKGNVAQILMV